MKSTILTCAVSLMSGLHLLLARNAAAMIANECISIQIPMEMQICKLVVILTAQVCLLQQVQFQGAMVTLIYGQNRLIILSYAVKYKCRCLQ